MKHQLISELLEKYRLGTCTNEELLLLEQWYARLEDGKALPMLEENSDEGKTLAESMLVEFKERLNTIKRPLYKRMLPRLAAAAILLVCLSISLYTYYNNKQVQNTQQALAKIKPGTDKAILTLADGSQIVLDSTGNGKLAEQEGIKVERLAGGRLLYTVQKNADAKPGMYNTITTPKGGQYQVILADGSKVWLNAASSLQYPLQFTGDERAVSLSGEAYFEVAKNAGKPFKVRTALQEVTVLGTHFNVNSYTDEASTKTTLLEGSVRVADKKSSVVITPGQQAQVTTSGIKTINADTRETVAWKNGLFSFKRADVKTVMRQVARWYDVEVAYDGQIPPTPFTGKIHRDINIQQLLESIGYLGLEFDVEGRTIIVKSKTIVTPE